MPPPVDGASSHSGVTPEYGRLCVGRQREQCCAAAVCYNESQDAESVHVRRDAVWMGIKTVAAATAYTL